MSATTTQLLSSDEFCELHYDTIPVRSASAKFLSIPITQKYKILSCDTLVVGEQYELRNAYQFNWKNLKQRLYFKNLSVDVWIIHRSSIECGCVNSNNVTVNMTHWTFVNTDMICKFQKWRISWYSKVFFFFFYQSVKHFFQRRVGAIPYPSPSFPWIILAALRMAVHFLTTEYATLTVNIQRNSALFNI